MLTSFNLETSSFLKTLLSDSAWWKMLVCLRVCGVEGGGDGVCIYHRYELVG
jgi:hypothetical protein